MSDIYHQGNRLWQDEFDSRKLADRVDALIVHDAISEEEHAFIASRDMFFISTVDDQGRPTVSYKGGDAGFIRVIDEHTIAFPGYDGNGMFLTVGNITANQEVGLLLIDFESPQRLRIHGTASVSVDDPLLAEYHDAIYIVRIAIRNLFLNCSRYIHRFQKVAQSEYIPKQGCKTPTPDWKNLDAVQDVLPNKP